MKFCLTLNTLLEELHLLKHPFCLAHVEKDTDTASFVSEILDIPESG